jgi:hypothetical protein
MKPRVEVEVIYGKNIATGKQIPTNVCRIRFCGDLVGYYSLRSSGISITNPVLSEDEMAEVVREVCAIMDTKSNHLSVAPISKQTLPESENTEYGDF